ncbi:MAG: archease [Thermodesulfobacteriota bacterium]|nr:archease [Thermodesulfobacteriota bacterium]
MPSAYEYIEHTGDLGFKVYGETLQALFVHGARALFEVLVSPETIEEKEERAVTVEAAALDELMVSWLGELLYLFDTQGLLLAGFEIETMTENRLEATVRGEPMDLQRHEIKTTIKAVTYHQLYVRKRNGAWEAQVILDL